MERIVLTCVMASTLLLIGGPARSADTAYNGDFWIASPSTVKHLYVHGVMGGILLGQDRLVRYATVNQGQSRFSIECQRALVGMANGLERQIENWDRERLVAALDQFFEDPGNRPLDVKWALLAVMLEMRDAPPEEIEAFKKQVKPDSP
ncbi:MAG: hypothetical protein PVJ53_14410 [Desulfobacterales bacterium]